MEFQLCREIRIFFSLWLCGGTITLPCVKVYLKYIYINTNSHIAYLLKSAYKILIFYGTSKLPYFSLFLLPRLVSFSISSLSSNIPIFHFIHLGAAILLSRFLLSAFLMIPFSFSSFWGYFVLWTQRFKIRAYKQERPCDICLSSQI